MHLSQCVDLFSDSNKIDHHVRSCIKGWLFKSTTEFHGWENDRLGLDYMFGALCWSYSVAGIVMFLIKPSWIQKSNFPHFFYAFVLTFLQGKNITIWYISFHWTLVVQCPSDPIHNDI